MTTPFTMREELIDLMRRDVLGPADGPEEELSPLERQVTRRYLAGMLAPGGKQLLRVDGQVIAKKQRLF